MELNKFDIAFVIIISNLIVIIIGVLMLYLTRNEAKEYSKFRNSFFEEFYKHKK